MKNAVLGILVILLVSTFKFSASSWSRYVDFIKEQATNSTLETLFQAHLERGRGFALEDGEFECEPFTLPERELTVHNLAPADIGVVAALGDSVTAGLGVGASSILNLLEVYRGLSFSIGGERSLEEHVTLASIIKKYNPNVKGFAVGSGDVSSENAHLNLAVVGGTAYGLPRQAKKLVELLRSETDGIDYQNDWKMITVQTSAQSLCYTCELGIQSLSRSAFYYNIRRTLDILHNEVPKAFVNLLLMREEELSDVEEDGFCDITVPLICPCGGSSDNAEEMRETIRSCNEGLESLVDSGRYDTREDFAVVVQPFMEESITPRLANGKRDLRFLSPNCFHPNVRGHRIAAEGLWNNMLEPVVEKTKHMVAGQIVICPSTEEPFFFTRLNSDSRRMNRTRSVKFAN